MLERIVGMRLVDRLAYVWLGEMPLAARFDVQPEDPGNKIPETKRLAKRDREREARRTT